MSGFCTGSAGLAMGGTLLSGPGVGFPWGGGSESGGEWRGGPLPLPGGPGGSGVSVGLGGHPFGLVAGGAGLSSGGPGWSGPGGYPSGRHQVGGLGATVGPRGA